MRTIGMTALAVLYVLSAAPGTAAVRAAPAGAGLAPAASGPADLAQTAPPQFLPWPPAVPSSTAGPFDAAAGTTLEAVLTAVQATMDRLRQWLESLREAAAAALAQVVLPLPVDAPGASASIDILTRIAALPGEWRVIVDAALAKLRRPAAGDPAAERHAADIAISPQLSHEATTIASADQQVVAGAAQQEIAVAATAAVADAAVRDEGLPAVEAASRAAADQLVAAAHALPSSRAGIELLVAGTGAALRQQAALTAALAQRMTGLMQQSAQLSGQVGALASTVGLFTERQLERDRNALDARLGAADAARGAGTLLQRLLENAAEPADEIQLAPLY